MKKKFTTTIDEKLLESIKIEAIRGKTSVSSIIENMIKNYLNHKNSLTR